MSGIETLQDKYKDLEERFDTRNKANIDSGCLLTFDYEYIGQVVKIVIDTPEFTANCPWTNLPDFGTLTVSYIPDRKCIELKSFKYYVMSYSNIGIVQEHAANRVLKDLVEACQPIQMTVKLDYNTRGGIHASVTASYEKSLD